MVLILAPVIKFMLSFRLDTILILKNVEKRLSGKYFSVSIDSNTAATNVAIPFLAQFFLVWLTTCTSLGAQRLSVGNAGIGDIP